MPGNKRERELARAKYERQQAKKLAQQAKRRQRYQVLTAIVVAVVAVTGIVIIAKLPSNGTANAATSTTPSASASTPSPSPSPTVTAVIPTDGTPALCAYRTAGTASKPVAAPPTAGPTAPANKTAKISLNGKVVTVQLFASKAPCTVNSFVHLAQAKYFDATPCHRLTTGSLAVLQCGDPSGTGSGGPGYQFNDENLTGATYPAGTVAMANGGPNTNGSQFFLVYADSQLGPEYTPFGKVTGGMDVLTAIGAAGVKGGGSDGAPANPVTLSSVVIGP